MTVTQVETPPPAAPDEAAPGGRWLERGRVFDQLETPEQPRPANVADDWVAVSEVAEPGGEPAADALRVRL